MKSTSAIVFHHPVSLYEILYRERPIFSNLMPFGCRGAAWILVSDKNYRGRGLFVRKLGAITSRLDPLVLFCMQSGIKSLCMILSLYSELNNF